MKLGKPRKVEVKPVKKKGEFQFRLWFDASPQSIEFEMTFAGAMMLMKGLQQMQATHRIPIPDQLRPSGKPKLSIVERD